MRWRVRGTAVLVMASAWVMVGCSGTARTENAVSVRAVSDDSATVTAASTSMSTVSAGPGAPFAGAWTVMSAAGVTLPERSPVRLEVSDGVVATSAGCQLITNTVTAASVDSPIGTSAAVLVGGPQVMRERLVRCAPESNALDDWLAALVTGPMRWEESAAGGTLTAEDEPAASLTLRRDLSPSPIDPSTFADPGLVGSFALSQWSSFEGLSPAPSSTPESEPAAMPTVLLAFTDRTITATGICAVATGDFRLTAGALEVQNLVDSSDPGCGSADRDFDDHVLTLLQGRPFLHRVADTVTLDSREADGFGISVNRVAVPADPAFDDVSWTLRQYQRAGSAAVDIPADSTATLSFTDGRVSLFAGCNYMGGMAYIGQGVIRGADVTMTAMSCGQAKDELDSAVIAPFWADSSTYAVQGSSLTIVGPSITLTFTR